MIKPEELDFLPEDERELAAKQVASGMQAASGSTVNAGDWELPDITDARAKAFAVALMGEA